VHSKFKHHNFLAPFGINIFFIEISTHSGRGKGRNACYCSEKDVGEETKIAVYLFCVLMLFRLSPRKRRVSASVLLTLEAGVAVWAVSGRRRKIKGMGVGSVWCTRLLLILFCMLLMYVLSVMGWDLVWAVWAWELAGN